MCASAWAAFVEMFMTTSTAELPGVTGVDGLKLHCAPAGSPEVQARVTVLASAASEGTSGSP